MRPAAMPALRKVCGVTLPADASHAAEAGANAIGMVFYPPSPRSIAPAAARRVSAALGEGVERVGVFVNSEPGSIADTVERADLTVVQLHGEESPQQCAAVRSQVRCGTRIWKALRVGRGFSATALSGFAVDAFLLDTARKGAYGGTGTSFAWQLALPAKAFGKIILAGGIDGSNAVAAIAAVEPWGVDASSRLESRPGVKDRRKVERYLAAVR